MPQKILRGTPEVPAARHLNALTEALTWHPIGERKTIGLRAAEASIAYRPWIAGTLVTNAVS
jgi:hypothetical protein